MSSGFPKVEARIHDFGESFDEWQRGAGVLILGKRANGDYAATVGGIGLSIPRQVAKTYLVSRIVFALCTLFPNLTVLWTAHRTRTATKTFGSLRGFASKASVAPFISGVRAVNGEQEIRFTNGSVIMFGAREQGFGRGFDEVDIEVFDETQILTEKALEDMVAATNQSRFPSGALLFFMGTPPRPTDPGEVFTARRAEALAHVPAPFVPAEGEDALYIECSADENVGRPGGPGVDDIEQIEIANPSYPHRTPHRSVLRLRKNLPSDESWRREGLGVWDPGTSESALIAPLWSGLVGVAPEGRSVFGVKFAGDAVALAGARHPADGPVFVEALRQEPLTGGVGWLVEFLAARSHSLAAVVVDGKEGAGPLVASLVEAGVPRQLIVQPTVDQVITAHSWFLGAVRTHGVEHSNQAELNANVRVAGKRKIGTAGGWGWRSIDSEGDVLALEAATLAAWKADEIEAVPDIPRRLY
ncbi:MAG: hypothetical protein M0Z51_05130 [Propionibacterium sp.]|nr:hypothetical protein [Propionibacterium sp.]